jgi:hypothetical protein
MELDTPRRDRKKTALICTDQIEYADTLAQKLYDYNIERCERLECLIDTLEMKKMKNDLPDILLVELYWKKDETTSPDYRLQLAAEFKQLRLAQDNLKARLDELAHSHGFWIVSR